MVSWVVCCCCWLCWWLLYEWLLRVGSTIVRPMFSSEVGPFHRAPRPQLAGGAAHILLIIFIVFAGHSTKIRQSYFIIAMAHGEMGKVFPMRIARLPHEHVLDPCLSPYRMLAVKHRFILQDVKSCQ